MPAKPAPRLLAMRDLEYLTGFERKKLIKLFNDRKEWAKPGGAMLIGTEYRLPESFYVAWVKTKEIASKQTEEAAHA